MRKIIVFLLFSSLALAQNVNRKFESFKKTNQSLEVTTSDGVYTFQPYSDKIISTSFVPNGEKTNSKSHAVVASPQKVSLKITTTPTSVQMATSGIVVIIEKSPFKISYKYKNKDLISEKTGYFKKENNEILDFNFENLQFTASYDGVQAHGTVFVVSNESATTSTTAARDARIVGAIAELEY